MQSVTKQITTYTHSVRLILHIYLLWHTNKNNFKKCLHVLIGSMKYGHFEVSAMSVLDTIRHQYLPKCIWHTEIILDFNNSKTCKLEPYLLLKSYTYYVLRLFSLSKSQKDCALSIRIVHFLKKDKIFFWRKKIF